VKTVGVQVLWILRSPGIKRNLRFLGKFAALQVTLVVLYAVLFDLFMYMEGREYSFITGVYWTLTTMSTLGFGDITFQSDTGRLFSVVVLLSGMVFMLVLLPFIIIEFIYTPLIKAQTAARTPRELSPQVRDHVLLTSYDAVTQSLIAKLQQYRTPYALIVGDIKQAIEYHDLGLNVLLGDVDDPETYRKARVHQAALVAATTEHDALNTNIAFTVREMCERVPLVSLAHHVDSVDILELAGSTQVLLMSELMGAALARCYSGGGANAHVLGEVDKVLMVEVRAASTPWVGRTLGDASFREEFGINVAGIWERGRFQLAGPLSRIQEQSVLIMAMSSEQLEDFRRRQGDVAPSPGSVLIIGAGMVGQATARALQAQGIEFQLVERNPRKNPFSEQSVIGDAADLAVLKKAGVDTCSTVIITTHSDDVNVFLTIYCRRLRPDAQLVARATHERNVATLHRAGADFVLSYASMGASAIFNHLRHGSVQMMVEGLYAKRIPIPPGMRGKSLLESQVRARTGCSVVAVDDGKKLVVNPSATLPMPMLGEVVLIVTPESEQRFVEEFG
jgi:Trk K+ transport system NAD-binding subunit